MKVTDLKIIIADDHEFLRKGLHDHLVSQGLNVVGTAADGTQALQLIIDERPDVAILDIEMPYLSGLSIADICRQKGLLTKVVILTLHKEPDFISQAKRLGISGYVLKEDASAEILACLESLAKGETYFSEAISGQQDLGVDLISNLTPSEKKILKLIAESKSNLEIAEMLFISDRTVEKHRSNVVAKLGLSGESNSLTKWAIENKSLILKGM
ncbi:MAG: response regulator transcription factor [Cyclobacteriaceae bacterium]